MDLCLEGPLFVWENELLTELLEDLESFRGSVEDDICWWRMEGKGVFMVKSMYKKLEVLMLAETTVSVAFSWKLFHDRIRTIR